MRLPHRVAFFYYLPWFVDVYGKKVNTSKMQRNAENACRHRMWQLGLRRMKDILHEIKEQHAVQKDLFLPNLSFRG